MMRSDLRDEFNKICRCSTPVKEPDYFLNLIKAIENIDLCESNIIHGAGNLVEYDSTSNYVIPSKRNPIRCELADTAFLVENRDCIRHFVVQNKVSKNLDLSKNSFKADLYQFELLHDKRVFSNVHSVRNPRNIIYRGDELNKSKTNSVSSYGVFFRDGVYYDMRLFATKNLIPLNYTGKSKERNVYFIGNFSDKPTITNGIKEIENCENIEKFEEAIKKNLIGEPFYKENGNAKVLPLIINYLNRIARDYQENHIISPDRTLDISLSNDGINNLESILIYSFLYTTRILTISLNDN